MSYLAVPWAFVYAGTGIAGFIGAAAQSGVISKFS
jgi:hypothetical protein